LLEYAVAVKYLLPCPCGQETIVEPRQAGETLQCVCGSSLQAPTLLEMTALEPAPEESKSRPSAQGWGAWNRVVLLGMAAVSAALLIAVCLYVQRPVSRFSFDPDEILRSVQRMPPRVTWENWETVKQGLDRRTDQEYADALYLFRIKEGAVVALALIGIALTAVGVVGGRSRRSPVAGPGTAG
jgi:hypothetical protein